MAPPGEHRRSQLQSCVEAVGQFVACPEASQPQFFQGDIQRESVERLALGLYQVPQTLNPTKLLISDYLSNLTLTLP